MQLQSATRFSGLGSEVGTTMDWMGSRTDEISHEGLSNQLAQH